MSSATTTRREVLSVIGHTAAGLAFIPAAGPALGADAASRSAIRVGIIGAGNRSGTHIAQLKELPDRCQITAVCDVERARAERLL